MTKTVSVTENFSGLRADKAASLPFPEVTRSRAAALLDEGKITINGKAAKPKSKVAAGDEMALFLEEAKEADIRPQAIALDIVYEDQSVLVINKARGMVVHPAPGNFENTLVNAVMYHCGDNLSAINGVLRPGIVHRIDKDTTGLLVVAKNDRAHQCLSAQLADRSLKREYLALVHGNIKEDEGTVNAPLGRSEKDRKKMGVVPRGGREAVTDFWVAERFGTYTLVRCGLRTGRTHQIRVHMRHIGHPIVGDKTYGVKNEAFSLTGQLLHAGKIRFIHPDTGGKMEFSCPLPADFEKILTLLKK